MTQPNKPKRTRQPKIADMEAALDEGKHVNLHPDGSITVSDEKPHPTIDKVLAEIGDEHNKPVDAEFASDNQPNLRKDKPQPTVKQSDRERAKEIVTVYKRFIAGYDNFESLYLQVAAELAAVREEATIGYRNSARDIDAFLQPEFENERMRMAEDGNYGWSTIVIAAIQERIEEVKQDLLSPSPCGKEGHFMLHWIEDWRIPLTRQMVDKQQVTDGFDPDEIVGSQKGEPYCTLCQQQEAEIKPLVEGYERLIILEHLSHGSTPFEDCENLICIEARAALKAVEL